MDLSIIIVSYNTHTHLRNCLGSVFEYLNDVDYEIIVVDNNSSDREIEHLPAEFPSVKFYLRDKNDGFGNGCNYGEKKSKGKYLLFLNPDIKFKNNFLDIFEHYLENNDDTGILSGKMLDNENNVLYFYNEFPSESWELSLLFSRNLQNKIDRLNSIPELIENKNFEVDWFHGAFLFMRKIDFESVGKFNESYFMYYEDVELCYKVKTILNKKNICIPEIEFYHSTKSSLENESSDNVYIFHLNRSKLLFLKNYTFFRRSIIYLTGLLNVVSRIILLPFWSKYKNKKNEKFQQLLKILKLYLSSSYLISSKYEYIRK